LSGDQFWALKDVSFDVQPGEVVGIIGRNGAGKSTLLKILSRITEPTSGRIELRGRVGSLLEVGTGFHPELTGRENIYMNGSILGMSRREIARKFDEIVAFAEVEDFLDTPVKRYSSGMYVRLAFAVAAHLEPEILIVDEVLAVGDAAFQRKCLNRMGEVARHGRTVLFVSHNLAAMESLCTAGVFLDGGRIAHAGDIHDGIRAYRETVQAESEAGQGVRKLNHPLIERVLLIDAEGEPTTTIRLGEPFEFRIDFSAVARLRSPRVILGIDDAVGGRLLTLLTPLNSHAPERIEGPSSLVCRAPAFPLAPGLYSIRLRIVEGNEERLNIERAFLFSVTDAELFDSGHGFWAGVCVANANWAMHKGTEPTT
jgi:lipopolysaccharide transport system ATP-binding protein